ncbi:hypothetical protein GN244_ATG02186 [Phytophthora infestans]|uniref:Uncharacterized protein n=1 Tax=Phytophthora infestans TaxID=4787 RepID=A0A833T8X0_PHYIN|nr:hypothetical protein GN244_ATG02186 [Phytophthora infestans]
MKDGEATSAPTTSRGRTGNLYISGIEADSGQYIKSMKHYTIYRETMRRWTSDKIRCDGKREVSVVAFDAWDLSSQRVSCL